MVNLVPQPTSITYKDVMFDFPKSIRLDNCSEYIYLLQEVIFDKCSIKVYDKADFVLSISIKEVLDETYNLIIDKDGINISGSHQGIIRAISTLAQLMWQFNSDSKMQSLSINDNPRFAVRGFMLDVSRHFFGIDIIKKLIDEIFLFKINRLHLHLTDDQGFRFEIPEYPNLTKIGAYRSATLSKKERHGGFFTINDLKEIVQYASSRGIEVVPEIDAPGHFTAVIASYPNLSCAKKTIDVATTFGIKRDIACASNEAVYDFLRAAVKTLADVFPSPFVHIGGDEADKTEWRKCKSCQEFIAKHDLKNEEGLQTYFTNRLAMILREYNKTAIVWNESLNGKGLDDSIIVQYWQDGKKPDRVINAINSGRKCIISKFSPYYLDYPHMIHSLKSVYKFEPIIDGIISSCKDNVIGIEAPLWTEFVDNKNRIDFMVFPRLTAIAETAWSLKQNKDYKSYIKRLKSLYPYMKLYGINPASTSAANPCLIRGTISMLAFVKRAFSFNSIKALMMSIKTNKDTKKARENANKI